MEQSMEKQSIRVKWYWKLFAKFDHEKTNADTTNRVFAFIIDWVIGTFIAAFPTVFMYMSITKTSQMNQNILLFPDHLGYIAGALSILFSLVYFVYLPVKWKGQTYGKRFMDLKIVKTDGSDVDFKTMLLREALGRMILEACLVASGKYVFQLLTLVTQIDLVVPLTFVSAAICVFSLLIALRCESKRTLHDYLAKTKVIAIEKAEKK